MSRYELYIPPARPTRDRQTGRFLKGRTPDNKGRKWNEYISPQMQERCKKGWENLDKYRHKAAHKSGKPDRKLVAVDDEGRYRTFGNSLEAAQWLGRGNRENIGRCARLNAERKICKINWRKGYRKRIGGELNDEHKYMGYKWYFYDDPNWWSKAKNDVPD